MLSRAMGYLQTRPQVRMLRKDFSCLERHKYEAVRASNDSNNITLSDAKVTTRIYSVAK